MVKNLAKKIRTLREDNDMTQTALARKLNVTRACVSAWEMEISNPSIENLVELALLFNVSTDYLLGVDRSASMSVSGLGVSDVSVLYNLAKRLQI